MILGTKQISTFGRGVWAIEILGTFILTLFAFEKGLSGPSHKRKKISEVIDLVVSYFYLNEEIHSFVQNDLKGKILGKS